MDSRMDKYNENKTNNTSRAERNKKLYDSVTDIDMDYIDINVDNVLEIATDKLTKKSRSDYQKVKELESIVATPTEIAIEEELPTRENKVYDINEILERARKERKQDEAKKRLINTEYNILTKLDINDIDNHDLTEAEIKDLIKKTYPEEEKLDDGKELFYDMVEEKQIEKELTEEILNKDVEDVFEDEDEKVEEKSKTEEQDEEIAVIIPEEKKEDKKEDEDLYTTTTTQILQQQKKSKKILIFVIVVVVILLAMGVYLFLKYFGTL